MYVFQRYLFQSVLRTLVAIVGGLVLIALFTQGLTQIELIVEDRQSVLTYLWVSVLAAPQIISLLLPIALFIAATSALNVAHRENEIVVAESSGMSNWQIASPVLRLAVLASILHLGLNLWVQPAAFREMRETVTLASTDLMASLVRPGTFFSTGEGLTTFAQEVNGREMRDLLVFDNRNPDEIATYIAKEGFAVEIDGVPAIVMRNGHIQQLAPNGALEALQFDQSTFDLAPFFDDQKSVILKESDRFLPELFFPDMTNFYENANVDKLLAEGHARIADPLLNIAMVMIALYAVLGGDFSRRGYGQRIAWASVGAVTLRLAAFGAASAGTDDPDLNWLQYALPITVMFGVGFMFFVLPSWGIRFRAPRRRALHQKLA